MASLFDLFSGSSESEDDIDYVPPKTVESDESEDETSDEEIELLDEPAPKKIKLIVQELKNKMDPAVNKSPEGVWRSFLSSVKSTPYGKANGKQNDASTSSETSKAVNKTESANNEKAIEANDIADNEVPDEKDEVVLKKEETLPNEKESDSVDKIIPKDSIEPKNDAKKVNNDAGKDNTVDVSINRPRAGLSSVLGTIANKGKKPSVLEKSLQDWKSFKEEQGIEKDLETFNKGRSGYIERQRFLERSDIRSFENEKNLRLTGRKLPGSTGKNN